MDRFTPVVRRTVDAPMAAKFGERQWRYVAQILMNRGCTADEAEAFMRSWHMEKSASYEKDPENPTALGFEFYVNTNAMPYSRTLKQEARALLEKQDKLAA